MKLGAYECAKATFDRYPLPNENDAYWSSGSGIFVRKLCEQHGMPVSLLSVSAQAAALLLFDRQWRHDAYEYVAARLVHGTTLAFAVDGLITLYRKENGGTRANARLQLMASTVDPLLFWPLQDDPVAAYMTYEPDGVHIHLATVLQVPGVDSAGWADTQCELTMQEQLECAVLSNYLSEPMRTVAHGQPICLPFDCANMSMDACLRFCAVCLTSGPTTANNELSGMLVCPKEECCYAEHALCCRLHRCPTHAVPLVELALSTTCPSPAVPLVARGIIECSATWCLLLSDWMESAAHAGIYGLLHPASISACVSCADHAVALGNWCATTPDKGTMDKRIVRGRFGCPSLPKRLLDTVMRVEGLCAASLARDRQVASCMATVGTRVSCMIATCSSEFLTRPPARAYADVMSFGQVSLPVPLCPRFATGLADALIGLQVYSEPEFRIMCARFRASLVPVDALLVKWIHLGLPLLPGTVSGQTPPLTAAEMHATVANGVLSARTKARSDNVLREQRHWCVVQAEPVLPASLVDDALFLQKLGLPADLPPGAVSGQLVPTSDVTDADDCISTLELGGYATSVVRVLMNPSMHVSAVTLLQDVAGGAFAGTCLLAFLMRNASNPISVAVTADDVAAFRTQCIRSSAYGRLFLLAIRNAGIMGLQWESDPTGLLCRASAAAANDWSGDWTPVKRLCICTGSSYVGLGAGSMLHWQQVAITGRPTVLFEYDITKLLHMPALLLAQESVHVVPCSWAGMVASDLPMDNIVCVMHREGLTPLPYSRDRATHTISIVPLVLPTATQFAATLRDSAWHIYCNPAHDAFATRASECCNAMSNT